MTIAPHYIGVSRFAMRNFFAIGAARQTVIFGIFFLITLLLLPVAEAFAARESQPLAADRRIRSIVYSPNEVFHFIGHYGYQSSIEFEEGEEIQTISIGDSVAWQLTPIGNRIFLKPVEQDADTNMTVITNLRTYQFELHAKETDDIRDNDMIFVLRFVYPGVNQSYVKRLNRDEPLPDFYENPQKYNFNYTMSGDERLSPLRIFDDGVFTYFEFSPYMTNLPAFFTVDAEGRESLVNFRMQKPFMVIEQVAPRFTLRHGTVSLCVFNEKLLPKD